MQIISKRAYMDTREGGKKQTFVEFTKDGEPGVVHVLHTQEDDTEIIPKLMDQEAAAAWITKSCGEGWLVPIDELGDAPTGDLPDPLASDPETPTSEPIPVVADDSHLERADEPTPEPGTIDNPEAYEAAKEAGTIGEVKPEDESLESDHPGSV